MCAGVCLPLSHQGRRLSPKNGVSINVEGLQVLCQWRLPHVMCAQSSDCFFVVATRRRAGPLSGIYKSVPCDITTGRLSPEKCATRSFVLGVLGGGLGTLLDAHTRRVSRVLSALFVRQPSFGACRMRSRHSWHMISALRVIVGRLSTQDSWHGMYVTDIKQEATWRSLSCVCHFHVCRTWGGPV